MTNSNLTHILFIRDRSGSMSWIKDDTDGGFDAFVEKQREQDGECVVTLVDFDDQYDTVLNEVPLSAVPKSDLQPRGMTALRDALGRAVTELGSKLASRPERERPGSVVVVVLTDGHENASHEWSAPKLRELILRQQDEYSWNFYFLGANQDAVLAGTNLGFRHDNSITYTTNNTREAFAAVGGAVSNYRGSVAAGLSYGEAVIASSFGESDRKELTADS